MIPRFTEQGPEGEAIKASIEVMVCALAIEKLIASD
jgi:hypothetical protein